MAAAAAAAAALAARFGLHLREDWVRQTATQSRPQPSPPLQAPPAALAGLPTGAADLLARAVDRPLAEIVARGALPPQADTLHKRVLPGPLCLQVEAELDVARSAMAQLDEIDGLAPAADSALDEIFGGQLAEAATQKSHGGGSGGSGGGGAMARKPPAAGPGGRRPPNRMLRLSVTDGVQTVTAMELQYCAVLTNAIRPGNKVGAGGHGAGTLAAPLTQVGPCRRLRRRRLCWPTSRCGAACSCSSRRHSWPCWAGTSQSTPTGKTSVRS